MIEEQLTPFEVIGETNLHRLVDTFYGLVAQHPDRLTLTAQHMNNTPDDDETGDLQ